MARHLSPAYVRIAGPSTEFVRYIDTDEKSKESEDSDNVTVTPSVWFAVNEWFNMANLTPVFGINDADTTVGVWNPKSILPLLEISDKFNLTCMWQLGYGRVSIFFHSHIFFLIRRPMEFCHLQRLTVGA